MWHRKSGFALLPTGSPPASFHDRSQAGTFIPAPTDELNGLSAILFRQCHMFIGTQQFDISPSLRPLWTAKQRLEPVQKQICKRWRGDLPVVFPFVMQAPHTASTLPLIRSTTSASKHIRRTSSPSVSRTRCVHMHARSPSSGLSRKGDDHPVRMAVLRQARMPGGLQFLLILPDGSKSLVPAGWTTGQTEESLRRATGSRLSG